MSLAQAYTLGVTAHDHGYQLGLNPYDPEEQPESYEAWVDGWTSKGKMTGMPLHRYIHRPTVWK